MAADRGMASVGTDLDARRASEAVVHGALPDPFAWPDGRRGATPAEWPHRAAAWRRRLVDLGYGGMPPMPVEVRLRPRSEARVRRFAGEPRVLALDLHVALGASEVRWSVRLLLPDANAPVGVVVTGDGCWWQPPDASAERLVAGGVALAVFDRTAVAPDVGERRGGLFDTLPGSSFGALAAWAWAYRQVVAGLRSMAEVDADRIGVTGFSRGGKAALLAAATDEAIAWAHAHASGAGGAAPFRYLGDGAETIGVARAFPAWFGPRLAAFDGRVAELPFDQHVLLAAIAPRPLLLTCGADDAWANPEGTVQAAWAAREVYRFVGAGDALAVVLRPGGHALTDADWAWLDGAPAWRSPDGAPLGVRHPYVDLRPAFAWRAP